MLFPGKDSLRRSHIKALALVGSCSLALGVATMGSGHAFAADTSRSAEVNQSPAICNSQGHSGYNSEIFSRTVANGQIVIYTKLVKDGMAQSYCAIFWHAKSNWNESRYTSLVILQSPGNGTYSEVASRKGLSLNHQDPLWVDDPATNKYLFFNTKISSDTTAANTKPSAGWQTVTPTG